MSETSYHVLRRTNAAGGSPTFQMVGRDMSARDGEHAIRVYAEKAAAGGSGDGGGELVAGVYVAVPARSWREMTVAAEVQTVIRLGDAT